MSGILLSLRSMISNELLSTMPGTKASRLGILSSHLLIQRHFKDVENLIPSPIAAHPILLIQRSTKWITERQELSPMFLPKPKNTLKLSLLD